MRKQKTESFPVFHDARSLVLDVLNPTTAKNFLTTQNLKSFPNHY